jgi:hypothetical protein
LQSKYQYITKVLAQMETENKLNESRVNKQEKNARKEV